VKVRRVIPALAAALLLSLAGGASATLYTGNNGSQSATANFQFTGTSSLSLTLTNLTTLHSIADILDDFHWLFSDTSFAMSLDSIFVSGGRETCTKSAGPPPHITTCSHDSSTDGSGTWGAFVTGGQVDMDSNGSKIHPYGIVNGTFITNASEDGLTNSQHNPVLLGPVTFNFSFTGLDSTNLSNVDFTFGTEPIHVPGTCTRDCTHQETPEPQTLALVGLALLAGAFLRRQRRV